MNVLYDPQPYLDQVHAEGMKMNDYSLTVDDMRVAVALFRQHQVHTVLEFGVNEGATAAGVLAQMPSVNLYVGVDLIPEKFPERGIVPKHAGSMALHDNRFWPVCVDGTPECFRRELLEVMRRFGIEGFDALIMDADHEEQPTQRDTELCWPFLRPGGLVLWHDYGVHSRQHDNGRDFPLKAYLDRLIAGGRKIHAPDQQSRDPWTCVSVAWEVKP